MEKRFFLALTLSITVFLLWSHFFAPPLPKPDQLTPASSTVSTPGSPSQPAQTDIPQTDVSSPEQTDIPSNSTESVSATTTPVPEQRVIRIETSLVTAETQHRPVAMYQAGN